jgi:hypothetical protein
MSMGGGGQGEAVEAEQEVAKDKERDEHRAVNVHVKMLDVESILFHALFEITRPVGTTYSLCMFPKTYALVYLR